MIFELVEVHKTRLGSAFGVPGATAVLSIKIDIPKAFDFVRADQALEQALGLLPQSTPMIRAYNCYIVP